MPRKINPKVCLCGCGEMTRGGTWKQGHDSKMLAWMLKRVGGVEGLISVVESHLGEPIGPIGGGDESV